mgnify:CR=1 FL=1
MPNGGEVNNVVSFSPRKNTYCLSTRNSLSKGFLDSEWIPQSYWFFILKDNIERQCARDRRKWRLDYEALITSCTVLYKMIMTIEAISIYTHFFILSSSHISPQITNNWAIMAGSLNNKTIWVKAWEWKN